MADDLSTEDLLRMIGRELQAIRHETKRTAGTIYVMHPAPTYCGYSRYVMVDREVADALGFRQRYLRDDEVALAVLRDAGMDRPVGRLPDWQVMWLIGLAHSIMGQDDLSPRAMADVTRRAMENVGTASAPELLALLYPDVIVPSGPASGVGTVCKALLRQNIERTVSRLALTWARRNSQRRIWREPDDDRAIDDPEPEPAFDEEYVDRPPDEYDALDEKHGNIGEG